MEHGSADSAPESAYSDDSSYDDLHLLSCTSNEPTPYMCNVYHVHDHDVHCTCILYMISLDGQALYQ